MQSYGAMLKDWRQRRRISQLALAVETDVSSRHISFLETGRSRPSRDMVLHLAEALDAPRTTRNGMLTAAGFAPLYGERLLEDEAMAQVKSALDWTLARHDPYPAVAMDRLWRLTAMNRSATAMFTAAGLALGDSLIEALLDPEGARNAVENWPEVAHHAAQRMRLESAALGGEATLDAASAALSALPEVKSFAPTGPLPPVVPTIYRAGPMRLSLFSIFAEFGTAEDIALADMKIEMMFPADDATRDILASMAQ